VRCSWAPAREVRRAITVLAFVLSGFTLAPLLARPAFAQGLGQSYDLPLPLWLYLYGAGAAVLASIVPISLFAGRSHACGREPYPRFDLLWIGPLRTVVTARASLLGVRLLSVAISTLSRASGSFPNR
jgi:hypothetical protein